MDRLVAALVGIAGLLNRRLESQEKKGTYRWGVPGRAGVPPHLFADEFLGIDFCYTPRRTVLLHALPTSDQAGPAEVYQHLPIPLCY